jgi:hypothetical protein
MTLTRAGLGEDPSRQCRNSVVRASWAAACQPQNGSVTLLSCERSPAAYGLTLRLVAARAISISWSFTLLTSRSFCTRACNC